MFWEDNEFVEESQLNKKLDSEDATLLLILDDIHCFQEIRNNNEKLLAYLTKSSTIRELVESALLPKIDGTLDEKEQYRFSHQCCEAICLSNKAIIKAIVEDNDIMNLIVNYLKIYADRINHLVVSFYAKIIVHLLGAETETVLNMLEASEFLESCMDNIQYGAIFEVLCGIINCAHDNDLRERVKLWYVSKGFSDRLISSISIEKRSEIHENTGAVWAEFVKSLRDLQYTLELPEDPLLNTLQSRESIQKLLNNMFPEDLDRSSNSTISNGAVVLNAMLETNFIVNSPSSLIAQEARDGGPVAQSLNEYPSFVPDPERNVEHLCSERGMELLRSIFVALRQMSEDYSGDVLLNCSQLLVNLVNTNDLQTHYKLAEAFINFPLAKLFDFVIQEPSYSIFNSALSNFIVYILYSHTGDEQPLLNFLFKNFNVIKYVLDSYKILQESRLDLIRQISLRTFLMNLAERIQHCRTCGHQRENINSLIIKADEWEEFCQNALADYLSNNCSETIEPERRSTSERISKVLEIDEVQDMDSSFVSPIKAPNFFDDLARRSTSPTKSLFDQLSSPPEPMSLASESPTKDLFEQLASKRASQNDKWPQPAATLLNNSDDWPTSIPTTAPLPTLDLFSTKSTFGVNISQLEEEEFSPANADMFPIPANNDSNKSLNDWPTTNGDPFSTPTKEANKKDSWADFCSPKTKLSLDSEEF